MCVRNSFCWAPPLSRFRISHFHLHFFTRSLFLSDIVREFHSLFIRNNLFERCFSSGLRAQFAGFPPFQFVRLDTLIINLLYRRSRTVGSVIVSLRTNVCHNWVSLPLGEGEIIWVSSGGATFLFLLVCVLVENFPSRKSEAPIFVASESRSLTFSLRKTINNLNITKQSLTCRHSLFLRFTGLSCFINNVMHF